MKHGKTRLTVLLGLLSIMLLCLGLAACGTKTYKVTLDYNQEQGTVTLSPTAENNEYGKGTELTVTVMPKEGFALDTLTLSTEDKAATPDNEGKFVFKVQEDTTIKVTFKTTEIAVSGITLTPNTLELEVGGRTEDATATLVATVLPDNATDKTVTWTSSDPTIATVEGGNVTALAAGETTITATAGGKSATCVVTVTQHVHKAAEGAEWKQDTENNQHYKECVCGEHVEVGAHSAKDDTYYQDEENNKHYQLCVCGARVNESGHNLKINADKTKFECEQCDYEEAHTHDTQLQDAGESGHKTVCKTEGCGYESAVTAHSAKDATYQQDTENNKHYQLCECGAKVNEAEHSAADEEEWEHDEGDKTTGKHWQLCECGAKVNEGTHEMDPEAFSDGAAGHHYECEQCGFKTETEAHVNESGKWTKHSDFNKGHYYNCSVCEAEVTQRHTMVYYATADGLYHKCNGCDFDEFISAHEMGVPVSDGDGTGTHHQECVSKQHGPDCQYKSESVSCASDKYITWAQITENPGSGHVGTCQCGNQITQEHDVLGDGGSCSKCGYLAGHTCVDNPDANGYYDGICDDCGKIVNNVWTFAAGTISVYNGNYAKLKIPTEIDSVPVTRFGGNFANDITITDVIIPEGIALTEIESGYTGLFYECSNLKTVVILASITTLPMMTFDGCGQLDWIVLPASLSTISDLAFFFGSLTQTTLNDVYFMGTQQEWNMIQPDEMSMVSSISDIDVLKDAHIHFYKADGGSASANEWRWDVDSVTPKAWE